MYLMSVETIRPPGINFVLARTSSSLRKTYTSDGVILYINAYLWDTISSDGLEFGM